MIKAIFFDFDGVILESVDIKTEAFAELFQDYPQYVDEIVIYHIENSGVSRFDKIRYFYKHILTEELNEKKFKELCDRFGQLVFQKVLSSEYVSGIKDFIQKYHTIYDLFIVSATPHEEIQQIAEQIMLTQYFKDVMGSPVPKGEWVRKVMEQRGYKKDEAVFVGDAVSDFKAAMENEIKFIARVSDPVRDCFQGLPVQYKTHDFEQLAAIIDKIGL